MSSTLKLAQELIRRRSLTPNDAGCQTLMIERLQRQGFGIERLPFGEVDNFWARRGTQTPLFCFAGHTDVVPSGPEAEWTTSPFEPLIRDGLLYGRGAADMKGSLAAMVTTVETFVAAHPNHAGSIAFLITSDEEGPAVNGTARVMETLQSRSEQIDYCLVGEPSSTRRVGDVIKNGRRGSLNGRLRVIGRQGHVAYPHLANNPLHAFAPILARLCTEQWDQGNAAFPPTSFQVSNLNVGTGAENVIPGELIAQINFRFSTESSAESLCFRVEKMLEQGNFEYQLDWRVSGQPFLTETGALVDAALTAVSDVTGYPAQLSTAGGTSDGRFIAPSGAQVLELGPLNATIHQVNECVGVQDLDTLSAIYVRILELVLLD